MWVFTFILLLIIAIFCLIIVMFRNWLYMLITIHDHAHLNDIYIRIVVFDDALLHLDPASFFVEHLYGY